MVVEDEAVVAMDVSNMLEGLGYEVSAVVARGEDAIEKAGKTLPDLILMDIALAGEMDGISAADRIRKLFDIPIVYITAYADEYTLQRAKATEPFGYMLKPIEERELRTTIEMALSSYRMGKRLRESEERYRLLADNVVDIIWTMDLSLKFIYISPSFERITGYTNEEAMGLSIDNYLTPDSFDLALNTFREVMEEEEAGSDDLTMARTMELELKKKNGSTLWIEAKTSAIRDKYGHMALISGVARDISERKRAEERIKYLSFHDAMTGLYNRAYFEEELNRFNTRRRYPIGIVVADIDDLKTVNDTLGHNKGDEVLKRFADILSIAFRVEDVVARIGGDEFAVILPNSDKEVIRSVYDRVIDALEYGNRNSLVKISASLGYAVQHGQYKSLREALRVADGRMYDDKLNKYSPENLRNIHRFNSL